MPTFPDLLAFPLARGLSTRLDLQLRCRTRHRKAFPELRLAGDARNRPLVRPTLRACSFPGLSLPRDSLESRGAPEQRVFARCWLARYSRRLRAFFGNCAGLGKLACYLAQGMLSVIGGRFTRAPPRCNWARLPAERSFGGLFNSWEPICPSRCAPAASIRILHRLVACITRSPLPPAAFAQMLPLTAPEPRRHRSWSAL